MGVFVSNDLVWRMCSVGNCNVNKIPNVSERYVQYTDLNTELSIAWNAYVYIWFGEGRQ